MKCTADRKELALALKIVLNAIAKKSYLPILQNVLLETSGKSSLILSTTDLEISIRSEIAAKNVQKGAICVPAKYLFEIVKSLPKSVNQVELELVDTPNFVIHAAGVTYQIEGMATDEFPALPVVDSTKIETISANIFCDMIRKVGYAISNDEHRPSLCGVLWQTSNKKSIMVATNGRELVEVKSKKMQFTNSHANMIIPLRPLLVLSKLLIEEIIETGVIFGDNNLTFICGNTTISTRFIEGPYPNYRKSIPKNNDQVVVVNRKQLLQALQQLRVSIIDDWNYQVTLLIIKNQLKLSTKSTTVELPCQFEGGKIEVAFNVNYLINLAEHIDDSEIKFAFTKESPSKAVMVTSANKNYSQLCLVMPLRTE